MKKIILILAILLCGCQRAGEYTNNNEKFVIGGTGPLTGDASAFGTCVREGADLAIKEINEKGGVNSILFELDMKDDKASSADASIAYDILYERGMQASIGSVTSGACVSFATRAKEDNLFVITPSASAQNVIEGRDNTFRICLGDPQQGVLAARELFNNFKETGVIYDTSDPYSVGIFTAFKDEMESLGRKITVQSFDAENKRDFSTQVEALKHCDSIFVPIYYTEAAFIAKTVKAKGINALLFGCDGLDGIKTHIKGSGVGEIKYITPFDINSSDEKEIRFINAYRKAYNKEPNQFSADGYDAVMVIYEAMKRADIKDVKIPPHKLCEILKQTITAEDFIYYGITGTMKWDKTGACTKEAKIVELKGE